MDDFFKAHPEYKIVHSHLDCMAGIPLKYAQKNNVSARIAHAHSSNQTRDKKYVLKQFYKYMIPKYATHFLHVQKQQENGCLESRNFLY